MSKEASAIDFYFDFTSPYGYFAATRIEQLAAEFDREVAWHPILLGAVFKTTGQVPLTVVPLKGDYAFHDFARTARMHGIDYVRPATFPIATQAAARAMLWIEATHGRRQAVDFALAAYRGFFVDGRNTGDAAQVAEIAGAIGLDGAAVFDAIQTPEIKAALVQSTEQAVQRKVFGSPYFIVDDEPFWGFDRLDQLRYFLQHGRI